jgi:hypothetical protein
MPLSVIRRMTSEDEKRIEDSAERFIARHEPTLRRLAAPRWPEEAASTYIVGALIPSYGETADDANDRRMLARLWLACFRRAVNEPTATGCGWGHIGIWTD